MLSGQHFEDFLLLNHHKKSNLEVIGFLAFMIVMLLLRGDDFPSLSALMYYIYASFLHLLHA